MIEENKEVKVCTSRKRNSRFVKHFNKKEKIKILRRLVSRERTFQYDHFSISTWNVSNR